MKTEQEESSLNVEELERDSDGKYILPLLSPFEYGKDKATINELILMEPKAKHIRKMSSEPTLDEILKICGKLCMQTDTVIDELSIRDMTRLGEFFTHFS